MLRLRTTTGLSMLALMLGIVGTGWLSTLTADWRGPPRRHAVMHHAVMHRVASVAHPARSAARHQHGRIAEASAHRAEAIDYGRTVGVPAASPELVPLAMPVEATQRWDVLRGHLDGRVVVHVDIDGSGRVDAASLVESSGDPVLDAHALRSVRGWRFAVPSDHPGGISGDLPMRFSSRA